MNLFPYSLLTPVRSVCTYKEVVGPLDTHCNVRASLHDKRTTLPPSQVTVLEHWHAFNPENIKSLVLSSSDRVGHIMNEYATGSGLGRDLCSKASSPRLVEAVACILSIKLLCQGTMRQT